MPDDLDRSILLLCLREPRSGVLEMSRRLAVARGTVQARLGRLERDRVLDWTPHISPHGLGYPVQAFTTLVVHQGRGVSAVRAHLATVPEVVEAFTVTGGSDVLCRVVARNHEDLQRVLDAITASGLVARTDTAIVLSDELPLRTAQLLKPEHPPARADRAAPAHRMNAANSLPPSEGRAL